MSALSNKRSSPDRIPPAASTCFDKQVLSIHYHVITFWSQLHACKDAVMVKISFHRQTCQSTSECDSSCCSESQGLHSQAENNTHHVLSLLVIMWHELKGFPGKLVSWLFISWPWTELICYLRTLKKCDTEKQLSIEPWFFYNLGFGWSFMGELEERMYLNSFIASGRTPLKVKNRSTSLWLVVSFIHRCVYFASQFSWL